MNCFVTEECLGGRGVGSPGGPNTAKICTEDGLLHFCVKDRIKRIFVYNYVISVLNWDVLSFL